MPVCHLFLIVLYLRLFVQFCAACHVFLITLFLFCSCVLKSPLLILPPLAAFHCTASIFYFVRVDLRTMMWDLPRAYRGVLVLRCS